MRLFLAVSPDEACRERLARDLAPLRAAVPGIRWVREQQVHATLVFLGEVGEAGRSAVVGAVAPVAARHASFSASLGGGGAFPGWDRPRVVWLGFEDRGPIGALGAAVGRACATVGFPVERDFRPHLTLGRVRDALDRATAERVAAALAALPGPYRFPVRHVDLVRSEPAAKGAVHVVIDRLPLGGA